MKGFAMETEQFDDFARRLSREDSSRRSVLRALGRTLASGAVAGVAARLGLVETAEGEQKTRKAKSRKRASQSRRKAHGQVRGEGRGKAKGKGKGKKPHRNPPPLPPPSPLPPECAFCNGCQMCQDGACVRDPDLDGVRCEGSGSNCGYCQGGFCAASTAPSCPDGICPQRGECCSGQKRCPDAESPTGFACVGEDACCPDQKKCDGGCIYRQDCCPEERPTCGQCGEICVNGAWQCSALKACASGSCLTPDQCCPEEWTCADGSCVAQDECCADERRCPNGACVSKSACCDGDKLCLGGECIANDECCPNDAPPCGECEVAVCENGGWGCQRTSGCCPAGGVVCPPVPSLYWPWPVPGIHLPSGCCRAEKTFIDPKSGRLACAEPSSGGNAWLCS
jgi:hypothetical protein